MEKVAPEFILAGGFGVKRRIEAYGLPLTLSEEFDGLHDSVDMRWVDVDKSS